MRDEGVHRKTPFLTRPGGVEPPRTQVPVGQASFITHEVQCVRTALACTQHAEILQAAGIRERSGRAKMYTRTMKMIQDVHVG